jgi:hypothetical protein
MISDAHADMIATAIPAFLGIDLPGQVLGEALLWANVASLRARYADRHGLAASGAAQAEAYRYRPWMGNIDPIDLGVQAFCAAYQCDEWDEFEASSIGKLIAQLIQQSGIDPCNLPEGYAWGIDNHPGEDLPVHGPFAEPARIAIARHIEPAGQGQIGFAFTF